MRRILLSTAALVILSAGTALATDLPVKAPAYVAVAPFSWNGMYIGAHVGYGWGDHDFLESGAGGPAKAQPSGWLGGVQIGYNVEFARNWIIGNEIDFAWTNIEGSGNFPIGASATGKVDYLGTTRTRLGYAVDRAMLYVTGGIAWARTKSQEFPAGGGAPIRDFSESHFGWTIGGGLEYAFDRNWSAKIEYLYADLGKDSLTINGVEISRELTVSTVKAGINYRFGAPVYASSIPVKGYAPAAADLWSGSYIGGHIGYAWSDVNFSIGPALTVKPEANGFIGGFQTGYNWRFAPNLLFGLEGDTSFGRLSGDDNVSVPGLTSSTRVDNLSTVRARLGVIADRALFYVTGGVALGEVKTTVVGGGAVFDNKAFQAGWTIGGGIEYAFDPRWTAKLEYLYADLGKNRENLTPITTDVSMSVVKFGVNYQGSILERMFGGR